MIVFREKTLRFHVNLRESASSSGFESFTPNNDSLQRKKKEDFIFNVLKSSQFILEIGEGRDSAINFNIVFLTLKPFSNENGASDHISMNHLHLV
jgi:hypothetical protein